VFVCGRKGGREDVDEGREESDWLEIAEISKKTKRSSKNFASMFGVRPS
jgi:hypothetical protein